VYRFPFDDAGAFLYISFLSAWSFNLPKFMKLVVGMVRSSTVCPMLPFANKAAMYSAFMSCHTVPRNLKMLLDFTPNFNPNFFLVDGASNSRVRIDQNFKPMKAWILVTTMQEYKPNNLWTSFQKYNEAEHPWVMMQE
jgi:hypothetical protein